MERDELEESHSTLFPWEEADGDFPATSAPVQATLHLPVHYRLAEYAAIYCYFLHATCQLSWMVPLVLSNSNT